MSDVEQKKIKIWLQHGCFIDTDIRELLFLKSGVYGNLSNEAVPEKTEQLLITKDFQADFICGSDVNSVLLPRGYGGNLKLIQQCSKHNKAIYMTVNGMGAKEIQVLKENCDHCSLILTIDCTDFEDIDFYKKLAWLKSRPESFAVLSRKVDYLKVAMIAGAHSLIIPELNAEEAEQLNNLYALLSPGAPPPLSPNEIDLISENKLTLTLAKDMKAGEKITRDVLKIETVSDKEGLAPFLMGKIIGCRLRYDTQCDEPLTFGSVIKEDHDE